MLGGQNKQPLGYTIIEVMIVLAISGFMFVIAAAFINGKQAVTAFRTGANSLASNIQDVIEQVTDGQYTDIAFTCNNSHPPLLTFAAGGQGQGTNSGCTFLGKFVYFETGANQAKYMVLSLAAIQSATDLSHADASPVIGNNIDLTDLEATPQNLNVTHAYTGTSVNSSHVVVGSSVQGLGFVQGLAGDQSVNLVTSNSLPNTVQDTALEGAFDGPTDLMQVSAVTLCVSDGTRYALVEVGDTSGDSQLSANVQFLPDAFTGATSC